MTPPQNDSTEEPSDKMNPIDSPPTNRPNPSGFDFRAAPKIPHTTVSRKKATTVVLAAIGGAALVAWLLTAARLASRSQDRLDLTVTVRPDDEFWISQRMPRTHIQNVYPLPRDQALALLRAMATAQPWEPNGVGRFSCSATRPVLPPMNVMLVWCKNWKERRGLQGNTLWIHSRNELVSYEGKTYIVPAEARKILNSLFPRKNEAPGPTDLKMTPLRNESTEERSDQKNPIDLPPTSAGHES